MLPHQNIESRFWKYVYKSNHESCWNWIGAKLPTGYGVLSYQDNGKTRRINAHRLSYIIHVGEIPHALCICHHCDNPSCVNPNHLFLGTHRDNVMDMIRKGRRGNTSHRKISPGQEQELIIELNLSSPGILERLSKKYGVSPETIRKYRNKNLVPGYNRTRANEIREKYNTKRFTQKNLADEYGLHYSTISLIVNGKRD